MKCLCFHLTTFLSNFPPRSASHLQTFPLLSLPTTTIMTTNHSCNFLQLRLEWWKSSPTLPSDTKEVTSFSMLKKILHRLHRKSRNWKCRWWVIPRDDRKWHRKAQGVRNHVGIPLALLTYGQSIFFVSWSSCRRKLGGVIRSHLKAAAFPWFVLG